MKQQVIPPKTKHTGQGRPQLSEKEYQPKYQKPHTIIPTSDLEWSLKQKPSVSKLWQECWLADPYGSRWMQISTSLSRKHFFSAKKVLSQAGLFIFKREVSIIDGRETVCWMVRNLHGARLTGNGEFWSSQKDDSKSQPEKYSSPKDFPLASESPLIVVQQTTYSSPSDYSISPETTPNQGFQKALVTPQQHLSNSSKEVLRCSEKNLSRAVGASEFSVETLKQENADLDALKQDPEHQAAVKSVLAQCKQKLLRSPHLSQHCVEKKRAVQQSYLDEWVESLDTHQPQTSSQRIDETEKLNQELLDPSRIPDVIEKVMASSRYTMEFDEEGNPTRVVEVNHDS